MTRTAAKPMHRDDAEVFAAARFALDNQPGVPGTVHIHVDNGTLTLTGTVRRPGERTAAEQTARQVEGVRRVVNLLTVWDVAGNGGFGPE